MQLHKGSTCARYTKVPAEVVGFFSDRKTLALVCNAPPRDGNYDTEVRLSLGGDVWTTTGASYHYHAPPTAGAYHLLTIVHVFTQPHLSYFTLFTTTEATC